jgi:hypothetical protein
MPPTSLEGIRATKKGTAVLARGTQNMAQKVAPHQRRERDSYQVAINEQSCLFLEILLFISIFLLNKWHERIRVGKGHQPCANNQPAERTFFFMFFWQNKYVRLVSATCVRLVSGTGCSICFAARRFLLLHCLCLPLQS